MSEGPNKPSFAQRTREALYARLSTKDSTEQEDLRNDMDFTDSLAGLGAQEDAEENHASVDVPIASTNKGFQMLKKMGWVEATPLGTRGVGITEPVQLQTQIMDFAGLGKAEQDEEYIGESVDRVPRHLRPDRPEQIEAEGGLPSPSDDARRRQAAEEARQAMKQTFSCAICNKQYKRSTELDTHLGGYEHHHRVRLMEMTKNQKKPTKKRAATDEPDGIDKAMLKRMKALEAATAESSSGASTNEAQPPTPPATEAPAPPAAPRAPISISLKLKK